MQRAEAILEQLKVRIQGGDREATINLNPVDLGRLRLHVKVDQGAVHASIAAESAETLAVLEAHAPELRAWLSRDGAESVELNLGLMTSAEADAQSRSEQGERHQSSGSRDAQRGDEASPIASPEALLQQLATRTAEGGVDLTA
jgi:flagellar hook-length control protein FliK